MMRRRLFPSRPDDIAGSLLMSRNQSPAHAYVFDEPWVRCEDGTLVVKAALGPWGAKMTSAEGR